MAEREARHVRSLTCLSRASIPHSPLIQFADSSSCSAQASSRVKNELKYAASLAKTGSLAVRGIFWDPAADVTSVKAEGGLAFPVRLHNTFLLEKPCVILGTTTQERLETTPGRCRLIMSTGRNQSVQ